ncbi:interleukin-20 receptor subunit alpha [Clarias gariepinus]|uniref:interleukin-20 receptor subunit alpha n=1 Tax=Clarias gariepinus TaxID=13013 RepID=UPI00234CF826|nr:interleukin-20 receptor subunit alpha [Clarias gariepinus]
MSNLLTAALLLLLSPVSGVWAVAEEPGPAAPRDVHFHSVNLRNTVRWSSGTRGDGPGTTYTVEYAIYGDAVDVGGTEQVKWRTVEQCADVTQTECDVTDQTSDTEEKYYARVRANGPNGRSEWTETDSRLGLSDTILGAPQVNVSVVELKLHVRLSGPFRWRTRGKKRQLMFKILPYMMYNITVYNNRSKRTESIQQRKGLLKHGPLEYNTEYCVRAEVFSLTLPLTSTPSDWICVSTPDDPFKAQMLLLMLGGVVPTAICLFVLAVVGGLAYYYICGHKQRLPKTMKDIQQDTHVDREVQMFQPEKCSPTINVVIISMGESKPSFPGPSHGGVDIPRPAPLAVMGEAPIQATYAAQDAQNAATEEEKEEEEAPAAAGLQSHHSSLGEDYGFVLHENRSQVARCPYNSQAGVNCIIGPSLYMAQPGRTEQAQDVYEEEEEEEENRETTTFFDWDRETGTLQLEFPLFKKLRFETPETTETQTREDTAPLLRRPVLTSVVVKQGSEEREDDDLLLRMEKDWNLQVQSTAE